jgi:hypothetical protein
VLAELVRVADLGAWCARNEKPAKVAGCVVAARRMRRPVLDPLRVAAGPLVTPCYLVRPAGPGILAPLARMGAV